MIDTCQVYIKRLYSHILPHLSTNSSMFENLDDNPRWCGVALDDLLRIVEQNADYDDYCRMQRHENQYIQAHEPIQVEDDEDEQLFKL